MINRIKKLIDESGQTATSISLAIGQNKNFISDIKAGRIPSADAIVKLADYFGVSTDYLLTGKENTIESAAATATYTTAVQTVIDLLMGLNDRNLEKASIYIHGLLDSQTSKIKTKLNA